MDANELLRLRMARALDVQANPVSVNRITANYNIYYERDGAQPLQIGCQYDAPLESSIQPYQREIIVTEDWMKLEWDQNWLPKAVVGTLVIQNLTGIRLLKVPTEEELDLIGRKNIYLGFEQRDQIIIRPRRCQPMELNNFDELWLRSEEGPTKILVSILAR